MVEPLKIKAWSATAEDITKDPFMPYAVLNVWVAPVKVFKVVIPVVSDVGKQLPFCRKHPPVISTPPLVTVVDAVEVMEPTTESADPGDVVPIPSLPL